MCCNTVYFENYADDRRSKRMKMTINVENHHSDGHKSQRTEVANVAPFENLDELWEELQEFTGDGHDVDGDLGYCHTITIVDSPDRPTLVGETNEWVGK